MGTRERESFLAPFRSRVMPYKSMPFNSVQTDFREPDAKRTFRLITKNDVPIFVNPALFAIHSDDFREKWTEALKSNREEVDYREYKVYEMLTIVQSVCPTFYNTYPIAPNIYDVSFLSHAAHKLRIPNLLRVCERNYRHNEPSATRLKVPRKDVICHARRRLTALFEILDEEVMPQSTWSALLFGYFDAAYRCGMKIELQTRFLCVLLCRSLRGYDSDNEMFRSETASLFLRALIQHRSHFFDHYGAHGMSEINPESPSECDECVKRRSLNSVRIKESKNRNRRRHQKARSLVLCAECGSALCSKCRRIPCAAKVSDFLSLNQLSDESRSDHS
ncbi:unnamed protein product [Anisakis simplex]|uniref:PH domain-containing protein n=1 Tax=Anisakis simplex TaxID=6269 RepID=A0A0M3KAZ3_ANISI|nr:unnamed protein product [Anisakis simplex]